ncbi:MAG: hypothetical protein IKT59_03895 [Bacteroidales bacterium]|nr:hypothetical protein [Bacteroidales bacterium]
MRSLLRLTAIFFCFLTVACNDDIKPAPGESVVSFAVRLEEGFAAESLGFAWSSSDRIAVKGASSFFIHDGKNGIKGAAVPSEKYIAAYPYSSLRYFADEEVSTYAFMNLPEIQTAIKESVCPEGKASVAYAFEDAGTMVFRPVLAFVRFELGPEHDKITSVSLMDEGGGRLSGMFSVDCASDDPAAFPMPDSYSNVVLRPQGRYFEPGVYHIAVIPGLDYTGFTLALENDEGKAAMIQPEAAGESLLERGEILDLGLIDALSFKSWEMLPVQNTALTVSSAATDIYVGVYSKGDFTADVDLGEDWIKIVRTKDVSASSIQVHISENTGVPRIGRLVVESLNGNERLAFSILQYGNDALVIERQRKILEDFYRYTNGDMWTRSDNWCTDLPLNQWYGVYVNTAGAVSALNLSNNNLSGILPPDIGDLAGSYTRLSLYNNNLTGTLPASAYRLSELDLDHNKFTGLEEPEDPDQCAIRYIDLSYNMIKGEIPQSYADFPFLTQLNLRDNRFEGGIPASFADKKWGSIILNGNSLSGSLPEWLNDSEFLNNYWMRILVQNGEGFDISDARIKGPVFSYTDTDGNVFRSDEIYASNEYTLLYDYYPTDNRQMEMVDEWFRAYRELGFDVVAYGSLYSSVLEDYNWKFIYSSVADFSYLSMSHEMMLVDRDGFIVLNPIDCSPDDVLAVLETEFGALEEMKPAPEDERDGTVSLLQQASGGIGIDLVIMGDAYTGEDISSGAYEDAVEAAMEAFFDIEPYSTYRHLFNVWSVVAVSEDNVYEEGSSTAFGCRFITGSSVEGNDDKCMEYAGKAVSADRLDETLVIVVMNSDSYGGTCYMYPSTEGNYGMGHAVAYIPFNEGGNSFAKLVQHEAGGHGFAKLADEYSYYANGAIPDTEKQRLRQYEKYGWWRNVDFTNDSNTVKWAAFLQDERYAGEGLDVYEGAFSYARGVWRSTSTSLMKSNSSVFNVPSREAIWCRIHRLAFGSSWRYDREDFVRYDAVNRVTAGR